MKAFHSDAHRSHAPASYVADGSLRPSPDVPARVESILLALRNVPTMSLQPALPIDPFPVLRATHSHAYLEYLRTIHAIWSAEFGKSDVLPDTFPPHRPAICPTKPSAQAGYYCFDMAAPITQHTWAAALASATCAISAADAILHGDSAAYALCRPPGHHAGPNYCGGFCYLNNVAVAAEYLLARGTHKKIVILDIDYHHGNGTQDIFYSRDDVLFISIHADPNTQYPYFWGHAAETGSGAGRGFTMNFPLQRDASESVWFEAFTLALKSIVAYSPGALLVSLGVDTHEADGVGDFHLTLPSFQKIGAQLRALHLPTALIQEGGYNLDHLGPAVAALLTSFDAETFPRPS